ncbi:MAG: nickel pincer cofactor biosynthesis protein LarC, partial [Pirellulaceae bacterium]|nr:nickel pincer cofactor biosynthesis protein LarC [Pirellulaceae bacterium]
FRACKVRVEHEPEQAHRHLHHITERIDASSVLTPSQKDLAKRIFTCIGEAEAKVHGTTMRKVHFHEVGAVDSIADIVGCAVGISLLSVDRIVCSPVPTGTGHIEIEHGRVSVPAPATAEILRGVPLAASSVPFELTTPTGAAIVKTVADEYGPLPPMTISSIGLGAGDRELKQQPNILRLILGEATQELATDQVWVLETNLDDTSGEIIGHTTTKLLEAGALDVYSTGIQMKKNRPGVLLSVLCGIELVGKMEKILFRETGTLGVRRWQACRHKLERRPHTVETPLGPIEGKLAVLPDGETSFSPEFEACRRVAGEKNLPLRDIYEAAQRAFGAVS